MTSTTRFAVAVGVFYLLLGTMTVVGLTIGGVAYAIELTGRVLRGWWARRRRRISPDEDGPRPPGEGEQGRSASEVPT